LIGCQGSSNIIYGARLPEKDKIPPNYARIYDYSQSSTHEKVEPWIVDKSNEKNTPVNRYRFKTHRDASADGDATKTSPQTETSVEPELPQ
jgi:hypothetical protein